MKTNDLARAAVALALFTVSGCGKKDPPPSPTPTTSASAALSIPSTPLAGKVGDQPFTPKKVALITGKGFGEWRMSIEGSTPTSETAVIRLPIKSALGVGKSYESAAKQITFGQTVSGVGIQNGANNTMSTNASYRVEITKWDVKDCPADGEATHEGGLASGKVFVKVPPENVEVAGTFTDAVVSYRHTPDWTYH